MKIRVIKRGDEFIPQYLDENRKFGPNWSTCHLTNDLVARRYATLESAQHICYQFVEKYKNENGEVVWESEIK